MIICAFMINTYEVTKSETLKNNSLSGLINNKSDGFVYLNAGPHDSTENLFVKEIKNIFDKWCMQKTNPQ